MGGGGRAGGRSAETRPEGIQPHAGPDPRRHPRRGLARGLAPRHPPERHAFEPARPVAGFSSAGTPAPGNAGRQERITRNPLLPRMARAAFAAGEWARAEGLANEALEAPNTASSGGPATPFTRATKKNPPKSRLLLGAPKGGVLLFGRLGRFGGLAGGLVCRGEGASRRGYWWWAWGFVFFQKGGSRGGLGGTGGGLLEAGVWSEFRG